MSDTDDRTIGELRISTAVLAPMKKLLAANMSSGVDNAMFRLLPFHVHGARHATHAPGHAAAGGGGASQEGGARRRYSFS